MIFFRYIFTQLLVPYTLGVMMLTFITSLDALYQLINLLIAKGTGLRIVWLLLYQMPQFLSATLPLGVVIAVIVVMARFSLDLEITAMQAAGCNLSILLAPILTLGFLVTVLTYFIMLWAQPAGYAKFEKEQQKLIQSYATQQIQPKVINPNFNGKMLYVDAKDEEETLKGVFIADQPLQPQSMVIIADQGKIDLKEGEREMKLKLFNGTIHFTNEAPEAYRLVSFDNLNYRFKETGTIEEHSSIWSVPTLDLLLLDQKNALLELMVRLTTPLIGVAFAIAALPLGMTNPRSGRTGSYLRGLILVIAYYILWVGTRNLSLQGFVSPYILWMPPCLITIFGIYSYHKVDKNLKNFPAVLQNFWKQAPNQP